MDRRLVGLFVGCALAACGGKSQSAAPTPPGPAVAAPAADAGPQEPDPVAICDRVADHVVAVMAAEVERDLATMPPEQAERLRRELAAAVSRPDLVARCRARPPDADEFLCVTNAGSVRELVVCDRARDAGPAREDCITVVDHILPLMEAETQVFAGDSEEARVEKRAGLAAELVAACLERGFSGEELDCILRAATLAEVSACERAAPERRAERAEPAPPAPSRR